MLLRVLRGKKMEITLKNIYQARQTIAPHLLRTPLIESPKLSERANAPVHLKLEILQKTGSFKVRGATNKILNLSEAQKQNGVVTASTGNHGRAVAYAAKAVGIPAVVCMSQDVPQNKVDAIQALGAETVIHGTSQDDAFIRADTLIAERGLTMVPPFDDPQIIAGQGTIGLEILEDLPKVDTVLVPLSGGGLLAGIALALKLGNARINVVGVSMGSAPIMYHSLRAGTPITMPEEETLADSLRGGIGLDNQYTFKIVRDFVNDVILVSEEEIANAMKFAFYEHRLVLEGAAAVGIAALNSGKVKNINGDVALILSGGNVDVNEFLKVVG